MSPTPTLPNPEATKPARPASRHAIRAVAFFEALKGAVVLLAATGLLALLHKDLYEFGVRLVAHTHLNPASKYPHIFLDAIAHLDQPRLVWLATGAFAYAAVRLVEAYGLFWQRAWAQWLAVLSGGLYVPVEVAEAVHKPSVLGLAILLANLAVVAVMAWALVQRRSSRLRGEA